MTTGPERDLAGTIRRLSEAAATGGFPPEAREAAARTGGVPVYADLGGVLVIAPDGSVLHCDPESDRVNPVTEEGWRLLALVHAARKFPELQQVRPLAPPTAITCPRCGGEGLILSGLDCGVCSGSGWIVESP